MGRFKPPAAHWVAEGKNLYRRGRDVKVEYQAFGNYNWRAYREVQPAGTQYLRATKGVRLFKTAEAAMSAADKAWPV